MKSKRGKVVEKDEVGYWPPPLKQFLWDMLPGRFAPARSGIRAPGYVRPSWLGHENALSAEVLEQAKRESEYAEARADAAEDKASRLVSLSLTLLGISFGLCSYHMTILRQFGLGLNLFSLLPVAGSIASFSLAGVFALEVDRPGIYMAPTPEFLISEECSVGKRQAELYDRSSFLAHWTADRKLDALLKARAWLSRGLVAIFVAGLVIIVLSAW